MKYNQNKLSKKIENSKTRKTVISNIIYVILVLALIINIVLVFQSMINTQKVPNLFGYKSFSITTGSMEPRINVNDLIITKNCKQEEINEKDIITYKRGDNVITHRVFKVVNDAGNIYYLTKGDSNYIQDDYKVKYKDIEGKYVGKFPKIGKVVAFFKNRKLVIAIILVFLGLNIYNNKKNKKKIIRHEQRRSYEKTFGETSQKFQSNK